MDNSLKQLYNRIGNVADLKHAAALLDWDQQTYMPSGSVSARARQLATLQKLAHEIFTGPETGMMVDKLEKIENKLADDDQDFISVTREDYEKQKKIPTKVIEELAQATSEGMAAWINARKENNYQVFLPYLNKIILLSRTVADYLGYTHSPYDALLDQYEPGITVEDIAPVFNRLGEHLAKMVLEYNDHGKFDRLLTGPWYPKDAQAAFANNVLTDLGFNFNFGRLDESAHPFTTSFTSQDVRLTTRYDENNFRMSFFGSIHEAGHGIYEQSIPWHYSRTTLGEAASLGFHESQSRFYENIIARSKIFWKTYFEEWKKHFPLVEAANFMDVYKYVNTVQPSLIRVEADEITYNLHIVIRFELEKAIIADEIKLKELPDAWNAMYEKYLGIKPDSDANGILQDVHWSAGLFGYFPTYTIGNLVSAQLKNRFETEIRPLEEVIKEKNFELLKEWFDKNIYRMGKRRKPLQLLKSITGSGIDAQPFLNYLTEKYNNLKNL